MIMKDAKKYLKIDYEEDGIFKKNLIRRSDVGKKIFFEEILFAIFYFR